jgi:hypothetical protein
MCEVSINTNVIYGKSSTRKEDFFSAPRFVTEIIWQRCEIGGVDEDARLVECYTVSTAK